MTDLNPIRLEIIRNALVAAAEEMSVAIRRTARSMMIRESLDFSTALFDATGRNIAQAALTPIHLNTMGPFLQEVLSTYISASEWEDLDVVLVNDPYCGGQHLPDITVFRPIFADDELIGFAGIMAHHTDIGGGAPGSYNIGAKEIFAEGLRIPPIKLMKRGELNREVWAMILQNVRQPKTLGADLMSQIGALDTGCLAVKSIAKKYGTAQLVSASNQILTSTTAAMRDAVRAVPEGVYFFEDEVDDEASTTGSFKIAVAVTIKDGNVTIDLTGSSPQTNSPMNCTLNIGKSCIYFAVMTAIAPHIPPNAGCYEAIEVIAQAGSIVNCSFPAPVVNRSQVGHRLVNTIMGAISQALPARIPAASYGVTYMTAVEIYLNDGGRKIFFDLEVGGWGGEPKRDGANGFSWGLHNIANVPIEVHEADCPVIFTQTSLLPDSGGAGEYRGGLGLVREWRLDAPHGSLVATMNRTRSQPYGLFGGQPGSRGKLTLIRANGEQLPLQGKTTPTPVAYGDRIRLETSGGGGFGSPKWREPTAVRQDIDNGYISEEAALADYGNAYIEAAS